MKTRSLSSSLAALILAVLAGAPVCGGGAGIPSTDGGGGDAKDVSATPDTADTPAMQDGADVPAGDAAGDTATGDGPLMCMTGLTLCVDRCVDTQTDRRNCGACGMRCPGAGVCVAGVCEPPMCTAPDVLCGFVCRDTSVDPQHCGTCTTDCGSLGYCKAAMCVCRPGLTAVGMTCVDTRSDPENCGGPGIVCDVAQVCREGDCVDATADGGADDAGTDDGGAGDGGAGDGVVAGCGTLTLCGRACVDTEKNPLHCGGCDMPCDADELCGEGSCRGFDAEPSCTTCPCAACRTSDICCEYPPASGYIICVGDGTVTCPTP